MVKISSLSQTKRSSYSFVHTVCRDDIISVPSFFHISPGEDCLALTFRQGGMVNSKRAGA